MKGLNEAFSEAMKKAAENDTDFKNQLLTLLRSILQELISIEKKLDK